MAASFGHAKIHDNAFGSARTTKISLSQAMKTTIAQRMEYTRWKSSGFDYIRLVLSVMVILSHAFTVSLDEEARQAFVRSVYYRPFVLVLPMFFALSGFLVAGSFERSSGYKEFYGLRVLRIVPALAVETTISALLLGTLFTTLPLESYFRDPEFWNYFWNIVGHIQYRLPGVFENNPIPLIVNSQLWTVPYELYCYVAIGVVALCGLFRKKWTLLYVTLGLQLATVIGIYLGYHRGLHFDLVVAFLSGIVLYQFKDVVAWDRRLALALAVMVAVCVSFRGGVYLCSLPIAYLVVYLGLLDPPKNGLLLSGDYSYGLYLYGFAIQQAVASFGPWSRHWYVNLAISLPIAAFCAVASWWCVEKPALRMRRLLRPQAGRMPLAA